jgi:hypothetical protein
LIFRLDYCGIAILIVGSIVPLLYYQFYCEFGTKVVYLTLIGLLAIGCIVISMWDRFSATEFRVYRACKFFKNHQFSITNFLNFFSTFYYIWFIRFYSNMSLYNSIRCATCFYRYDYYVIFFCLSTSLMIWVKVNKFLRI